MINHRDHVSKKEIARTFLLVRNKLRDKLAEKGPGGWNSTHEILGIVTEEYQELIDAVKNNNMLSIKEELADIAVGCIFGMACISDGKCEW